ncbi:dTDP-glucose 4,6-dehydratase [Streptomyces camponoticapitis]|uniref:dTDP-glucose 4,6-dehydratase n=1 Tax=Streptomyces camponoticapitis TaxID=1616125 RepID=A0ABQ2E4P0_9ACTN|nr:NAD(P)-dependent oxidoreductase [Streptomyces camponoticapitis]GGJ83746.1 dTDP-glucose 4,6-dehydratase [Streptomyces camponoticapitis]
MKVLLAGASGTLGHFLVPQLMAAGHEVIAVTRFPESAERLRRGGASAVLADVLDRSALLAALEGLSADAVVHELTALTKAPLRYADLEPTNRLRVEGTRNLLDAGRQMGATRFVTQSMFLGYGFRDLGSEPLTEDAPFAVPTGAKTDPVLAALKSTEDQVLGAGPGIAGTALRYGLFYGGDSELFAAMMSRRRLPVPFGRTGTLALIHHKDAASATVAALERGAGGRVYNVVDNTPATWRELMEEIARTTRTPGPIVLPAALIRLAAPYIGQVMTRINVRVSNERARTELGWTPRFPGYREGLAANMATAGGHGV